MASAHSAAASASSPAGAPVAPSSPFLASPPLATAWRQPSLPAESHLQGGQGGQEQGGPSLPQPPIATGGASPSTFAFAPPPSRGAAPSAYGAAPQPYGAPPPYYGATPTYAPWYGAPAPTYGAAAAASPYVASHPYSGPAYGPSWYGAPASTPGAPPPSPPAWPQSPYGALPPQPYVAPTRPQPYAAPPPSLPYGAVPPPSPGDPYAGAIPGYGAPLAIAPPHETDPSMGLYAPPTQDRAPPPSPFYFSHLLPVKLGTDNYLSWRAQVLPLLRSRYLEGYVDGSIPCPPPHHPAYHTWVAQDQAILSAIQSSLTPSVSSMVIFAATSREAWAALHTSFASQT